MVLCCVMCSIEELVTEPDMTSSTSDTFKRKPGSDVLPNGRIFGPRPMAPVAVSGDGGSIDAAGAGSSASASAPFAAAAPIDPAPELAALFSDLFSDFPSSSADADAASVGAPAGASAVPSPAASQLTRLRQGALQWASLTWQQEWDRNCGPMVSARAIELMRQHGSSQIMKVVAIILIVIGALLILS
jgi:hypothetical protein